MTIVVVGKSSFLAKEVARHPAARDWLFLPHDEALAHPGCLDDAETVINFAFAPQFKKQHYETQSDVDGFIARMIGARPIHYIMLSSRMVYGQTASNLNLTEEREPAPSNAYGTAKLAVEQSLQSILGNRLTILRLPNVFGFEPGRASFFGQMLATLASRKKIIFDMSPDTQRDFLPARHFAAALTRIAAAPVPGTYNLGSGLSTKCGDVAAWLIEGYGAGKLEVTSSEIRDQFSLDAARAKKTWDIPVLTSALLHADILACGKMLREN